jgi:hypothetical protein
MVFDLMEFGLLCFEPMHEQFNFTLERRAVAEGLNSHGDLPHFLPSDSVLQRDLVGEKVFVIPPWELAQRIARYFRHPTCAHLRHLRKHFSF